MDVEEYFCISARHLEYYPASAFQTPIYQLLRFYPEETIDFILSFTNKTVKCYADSELDGPIEEVEVFVDKAQVVKQYISNRIWNMYRGTQVSTYLLESIHMALEKWLLESAKSTSKENLESWCLYLIKNSKSASITAVVASVVLAYPFRLFDIAEILCQTREFFLYDTNRFLLDQTVKSTYSIGYGIGDHRHEIHQHERIKTCDDKHRKISLEHVILNYQFFVTEEENQSDAEKRQKEIWEILDKYYKELAEKSEETESDKVWRLYLARMDRRKMSPEVEEKEGQVLITFNPEIDPELKKYSEESQQKNLDAMRYTPLKLWSDCRFRRDEDKYKQYKQYEDNPQLVIKETREITEGLKEKTEGSFSLFNHSIPSYACSVLVRDFLDELSKEEKEFCKEMIIEFASIPLQGQYRYQISDGTEPAIISLPELFGSFPNDTYDIKLLLMRLLLSPWEEISTFATRGIFQNLWEISFEGAHSIFLGYLLLAPKYEELAEQIRIENLEKEIYERSEDHVLGAFIKQYKNELERIASNKIAYEDLDDLGELDLEILKTAFELLPLRTNNEDHKKYVTTIFPIFSRRIFINDERIGYRLKHRFMEKFAYFVLTSTKEEIEIYLKPFIANFSNSEDMADFFREFISVEDRLNQYEEFWIVWYAFYGKIVELYKNRSSYNYAKEVIHNYLLAWPYWKKDVKEWHTLKEREKLFFRKVAKDMGYHPSVLYSLSKILNDIGSNFLEDGILWISGILQEDNNLLHEELEINTIYYIENLVRRYILTNRREVRTKQKIKDEVLVILNFLIERGSVTGYLLRESIL